AAHLGSLQLAWRREGWLRRPARYGQQRLLRPARQGWGRRESKPAETPMVSAATLRPASAKPAVAPALPLQWFREDPNLLRESSHVQAGSFKHCS
ncbi:unnamed protein product, partial [Urochloa humidicola]